MPSRIASFISIQKYRPRPCFWHFAFDFSPFREQLDPSREHVNLSNYEQYSYVNIVTVTFRSNWNGSIWWHGARRVEYNHLMKKSNYAGNGKPFLILNCSVSSQPRKKRSFLVSQRSLSSLPLSATSCWIFNTSWYGSVGDDESFLLRQYILQFSSSSYDGG